MRQIVKLSVRMIGRSIDKSSGSPLTRWLLIAATVLLPVAMIAATSGRQLASIDSPQATVANLLIFVATITTLMTLTVTLAWRVDERFLEIFETSPMPTPKWQFALLIPNMLLAAWIALASVSPLLVDAVSEVGLGVGQIALVLGAALTMTVFGVLAGTVVALALRRAIIVAPAALRSVAASIVLLASSSALLWSALKLWERTNDSIATYELSLLQGNAIDAPFNVTVVSAAVILLLGPLCVWLLMIGLRLRFTAIQRDDTSALKVLYYGRRVGPASLGSTWLRSPHSAAQLGIALLMFATGVVVGDLRWVAHLAIAFAGASFVGFAPGNVGMRSIVGVGAVSPLRWFATNTMGAIATWLVMLVPWMMTMQLLGESFFETTIVATLVMAIALVVGGVFAYSYRTSSGAEFANLVVYALAAAAVLTIINRDVFGQSETTVTVGLCLVVLAAAAASAVQAARDVVWREQ